MTVVMSYVLVEYETAHVEAGAGGKAVVCGRAWAREESNVTTAARRKNIVNDFEYDWQENKSEERGINRT